MLHWQLLHWLKGLSLATRVGIFSCVGHLCLLFALFVVYKGNSVYNVIISSTMINTDAKIVYMPLHRSIKQSPKNATARVSPPSSSPSAAKTVQTNIDQGSSTTIIARCSNPSMGSGRAAKRKNNKLEKVKKDSSVNAVRTDKKKIDSIKQKPIVEQKKVVEEKKASFDTPLKATQDERREAARGECLAKRDVSNHELKPEAAKTKELTPEIVQPNSTIPENTAATQVDPSADNIVYVGQAEMEALQLQEYIQNEMAAHWTPPAGIRADAECIVKIMVSHDGKNNQIVLEQPSKILLFDSAARKAAAQLQPPAWAYGKEILITFKP